MPIPKTNIIIQVKILMFSFARTVNQVIVGASVSGFKTAIP